LGHFFLVPKELEFSPELPSPLFRFQEELYGSEYEGKFLFTPPFDEQVPRPELDEYFPLLQREPAFAVETGASKFNKMMAINIAEIFFILIS
jgi:hypothetical protein